MLGIRNETIAIGLVLLSGFFFGLIISSTDEKWGLGEGVTAEMLARCQTHSLKLGIAIALPSGAAVAVAILAENGGGLVGVAISASLLPPSVNAVRFIKLYCCFREKLISMLFSDLRVFCGHFRC